MLRLSDAVSRVADRPRVTLTVLCVAQALALLLFALTTPIRNGWLFYQGGDQIWYTTTSSLLAHLQLPPTSVGYGWSMVLAPLVGPLGPDFLSALPPVLLLDALVLAPLGTLLVYGIGAKVAGRLFALWLTAVWIAAPYVSLLVFVQRYHDRWVDQALPQALGLTALSDYPSMIALLAAALFVLRSLRAGGWADAVLAGALAGLALGIKPSSSLFLAGVVLAYLLSRRAREAAVFGIALVPALITLTLWKQRGLGSVPLFSLGETHQAAGATVAAMGTWLDRYTTLDWDVWRQNMSGLREFTVSARLIQWAPIAGAVALGRRSLPAAGLFAGWLAAYVLIKGTSPVATVESGSFWRLLMPAFPAYLVLVAAIPLLVPTLARRLGARLDPVPVRAPGIRTLALAAVVLALVPFVWVAASSPIDGPGRAVLLDEILTPVDGEKVSVALAADGEARHITWSVHDWPANVFYRVFRTPAAGPDVDCPGGSGAARCSITMELLGTTRRPAFTDGSPPPGVTYRVAVAANAADDVQAGDVLVLSPPVLDTP